MTPSWRVHWERSPIGTSRGSPAVGAVALAGMAAARRAAPERGTAEPPSDPREGNESDPLVGSEPDHPTPSWGARPPDPPRGERLFASSSF